MTDELKTTIKNFLVDWDHTSMDEDFGLADYDLWMTTAISLLEQTTKETQYIVKYYWPKNHHEVYSFVCMADDAEHAIEQCENAYPSLFFHRPYNCHILSVDILENN